MKKMKLHFRWRSVLLGLGTGLIALTAVTALGAWLMSRGTVGLQWLSWWAAGALMISGLIGSAAARLDGGSIADGALTLAGELVVLLGLNGCLCSGKVEGLAVTALALAGGGGAAMLLGMNRGRGRKHRSRR